MNYLDIMESEFFKSTYSKIEELKKAFPVNHGVIHINNVLSYANRLAELFSLNSKQKEQLFIACALHDIGYLKGRENHAENGSISAHEFLLNNGFCEDDIEVICNAIKNHGGKRLECFYEPVSMCLAFADKLDFAKNRYKNDIANYPEIKPYLNILHNEVSIRDNVLKLDVFVNCEFNLESLKDDYFNTKLKNLLQNVANSQNLNYELKYIIES